MPLTYTIAEGLDEVDVIICGGGTAGCVVAGRLAEADPNLSILMIEGGPNNEGIDTVETPILMPLNLVPDTKTAMTITGKKAEAVADRAVPVQTGGCLGGGSSINFQLYSRAQGADFDSWNMPGWSATDLIPLMSKLECFHGPTDNEAVHGKDGPVQITDGGFRGIKSQDDFLDAASRLGHTIRSDMQDPTAVNMGFQPALKTVNKAGKRHDAARAYIHPLLKGGKHPNLHVLCESKVTRVLVDDNKRACGVEYMPSPDRAPVMPFGRDRKLSVKARRLVVVSSGALGTPLVLERSGIGNPDILDAAKIPIVADVPGVGADYDDHTLLFWPFTTNLGTYDTAAPFFGGQITAEDAAAHGMMSWNMIDVHGKLRPSESEVEALGPEFQKAWKRDFEDKPTRPLMLSATACFINNPAATPGVAFFAIASYTAYSYSRGYIHVTGPEVHDPVDFDHGFLSDSGALDLKMHLWHYKKIRQIMRSTKMYTGEFALGHPDFPEGSAAAVRADTSADAVDADPVYTAEDDEAIIAFLRKNVATTWHSASTAKMAPSEQGGVVDEKLNVYGVQGLKCVDLSIIPSMVSANTCNTAYVVGEKGAEIIMRELGMVN